MWYSSPPNVLLSSELFIVKYLFVYFVYSIPQFSSDLGSHTLYEWPHCAKCLVNRSSTVPVTSPRIRFIPPTALPPFLRLSSWTSRYPDRGVLTLFAVPRWCPRNAVPVLFSHWQPGLFLPVNRSTYNPLPCALWTSGENLSSTDLNEAEDTAHSLQN